MRMSTKVFGKSWMITFAGILAFALLIPLFTIGASNGGQGAEGSQIVAALGVAQVQGQDVIVEVIVQVPPGANASEAAREALQRQGARPFDSASLGSEGFTTLGFLWDNGVLYQNYNPGNEPSGIDGLTSLTNTYLTWGVGVDSSFFEIRFGGLTDREPSLVRESKGPQFFDGLNDVAWLRLDRFTLGVTWFGTSSDGTEEADIALNTRFSWADDGVANVDVETVFLHENGHVVGLGHSDTLGAIMEPVYAGPRQALHLDDIEGVTFLYDFPITGIVSGTVTDGAVPIAGATVVLEGTSLKATTGADGIYTISDVPDPVTYTVTVSADGFESATILRLKVNGVVIDQDFTLTATGGEEDGGGKGPPPGRGPNK